MAIFEGIGANMAELERYTAEMGFMHAMQAGHSSVEAALPRILALFNEEPPTGPRWHADLIQRIAIATDRRPPILDSNLTDAADETRQFRYIAVRAYDNFKLQRAHEALAAARLLAAHLRPAIARLRSAIDP